MMKIGDDIYNMHFRHMVIDALVCGLNHPVEWVENYSRGCCVPDNKMNQVDEFCDLAIRELFGWYVWCDRSWKIEDITMEMCNNWIDQYYKQGK